MGLLYNLFKRINGNYFQPTQTTSQEFEAKHVFEYEVIPEEVLAELEAENAAIQAAAEKAVMRQSQREHEEWLESRREKKAKRKLRGKQAQTRSQEDEDRYSLDLIIW